ncbi:MAG: hypothetical protein HRT54_01425 [Colwellia sp.]|nr:hypothetical protein [Colwellia sp.]
MLSSLILSLAMSASPAPVIETDSLMINEIGKSHGKVRIGKSHGKVRIGKSHGKVRIGKSHGKVRI